MFWGVCHLVKDQNLLERAPPRVSIIPWQLQAVLLGTHYLAPWRPHSQCVLALFLALGP